jgi:hypothetical protein
LLIAHLFVMEPRGFFAAKTAAQNDKGLRVERG